jgi:hypothetical protein
MWKITVLLLTLHSCVNAGNMYRNGKYRASLKSLKMHFAERAEERKEREYSRIFIVNVCEKL